MESVECAVSLRSWDIRSELSRGGTLENQVPSVASNHSCSFTIWAFTILESCASHHAMWAWEDTNTGMWI